MGVPKTDLTGQKVGELSVIEYIGKGKWRCQCSCGKEKLVDTGKLLNMTVTSCGHDRDYSTRIKDITGQNIGEWKVLEYLGNQKYNCLSS